MASKKAEQRAERQKPLKDMMEQFDVSALRRSEDQCGSLVGAQFHTAIQRGGFVLCYGRDAMDAAKIGYKRREWLCDYCRVPAPPGKKFSACAACRVPRYCDAVCQKLAWGGVGGRWHRVECFVVTSLRAKAAAAGFAKGELLPMGQMLGWLPEVTEQARERFGNALEAQLQREKHAKDLKVEPLRLPDSALSPEARVWEKAFEVWTAPNGARAQCALMLGVPTGGKKPKEAFRLMFSRFPALAGLERHVQICPLHLAVSKKNAEALRLFLRAGPSQGCDVNSLNDPMRVGNTALFAAVKEAQRTGYAGAVEELLRAGADPELHTAPTGCAPIWQAAWDGATGAGAPSAVQARGVLKVVRALLEAGANPNPPSTSGIRHSLLIDFLSRGDVASKPVAKMVGALLRAPGGGASANECTRSPDQFGLTPLHMLANHWAAAIAQKQRDAAAHCQRIARDLIVLGGADLGAGTGPRKGAEGGAPCVNYTPLMHLLIAILTRRKNMHFGDEVAPVLLALHAAVGERLRAQLARVASARVAGDDDGLQFVVGDLVWIRRSAHEDINDSCGWIVATPAAAKKKKKKSEARRFSVRCIERGRSDVAGKNAVVSIEEAFLSHTPVDPLPLGSIVASNFRRTLWLDVESDSVGPMMGCPAGSRAFNLVGGLFLEDDCSGGEDFAKVVQLLKESGACPM